MSLFLLRFIFSIAIVYGYAFNSRFFFIPEKGAGIVVVQWILRCVMSIRSRR